MHQEEARGRSTRQQRLEVQLFQGCIKRHSASAAGGDSTCLQMREQASAISNQHFLTVTYFLARLKFIVTIVNNANVDNYKMMH